jgi:hypothetical protein
MLADVGPCDQEKVGAPDALRVALFPEQTAVGPVMAITGTLKTVTLTVRVMPHPFRLLVPVTEYMAEAVGFTTAAVPVVPLLHRNVSAPDAVSVRGCEAHTLVLAGDTVTDGAGSTVTDKDAGDWQPFALVPLTMYIELVVGPNNTMLPVALLGHEYDAAPLAVNVAALPSHIVASDGVIVMVGCG